MEAIGERFKTGEIFIPEVLLSARAMNEATAALEPYLASAKIEAKGRVLIGTVKGDLHDIGKNLVVTMLKGVGFEIKDLGINVEAEVFVREVERFKPDILGLSALLTTTMSQMKIVIDALAKKGLRGSVKIMVGGAPVNEKFARDIGADGYAVRRGGKYCLSQKNDGLVKSPSAALRFNFVVAAPKEASTPQFLRALHGRCMLCVPRIGREASRPYNLNHRLADFLRVHQH